MFTFVSYVLRINMIVLQLIEAFRVYSVLIQRITDKKLLALEINFSSPVKVEYFYKRIERGTSLV